MSIAELAARETRRAVSGPNETGSRERIHVLGGGPAGLSVAYFARRAGLSVRVYEAGADVGGNARTLASGPFRFDTGAHRLHDRDPLVTRTVSHLLGDDRLPVDAPSAIVWNGRYIRFPLEASDLVRQLGARRIARIGAENLLMAPRRLSRRPPRSFEELASRTFGPTLARLFLLDYTQKLWGLAPSSLAPEVAGGRLRHLDVRTLVRPGSAGSERHLEGRFHYPRMGIGQLMERMAAGIGRAAVRRRSPVTAIRHDGRRVRSIVCGGRSIPTPGPVVSTLPLPVLARLLWPTVGRRSPGDRPCPEATDTTPSSPRVDSAASRLRHRDLQLGVVFVDRPRCSPYASLYFTDPATPFTRATEPKNRSAAMAPADRTALVVEIPCRPEDANWTPAELRERALPPLVAAGLLDPGQVLGVELHRVPRAYPVLDAAAADAVSTIQGAVAPIANLHTVGRNAHHDYLHLHDLVRAAATLVAELAAPSRA